MNRNRLAWVALALPAVLLLRCKSDTTPLATCVDPTALSIGTGTTPSIAWDPACFAYSIVVLDTASNHMWGIKGDSGNTILPTLTYGVTPAGPFTTLYPPATLVKGQKYVVGLIVFTGPLPNQTDTLNAKVFTP